MNMKEKIHITFLFNNTKKEVEAETNSTILEVAEKNNIPLKGACEGNGVCGTCHVIIDEKGFTKLDDMDEQEEDTLDLVPELNHCSRLACKIKLTKKMDGLIINIPAQNRNLV
jgi:2Fe-2S ferredoxin